MELVCWEAGLQSDSPGPSGRAGCSEEGASSPQSAGGSSVQPLPGTSPCHLHLRSPSGSLLSPEAVVTRTGPGMASWVFSPMGTAISGLRLAGLCVRTCPGKQTDQKAGSQRRQSLILLRTLT